MNRGLSIWLDVLRVAATLVVVFSHFAYARFSGGGLQWFRDINFGSDAVVVFFVVSGFVIAFAADRDGDGRTYAFNRLTRLWSVMIPAIILTIVFDALGHRVDLAAYPDMYYHPQSVFDMFARGATFTNEFSSLDRLRLGTNGPLWSLSYEAAYYALFGVAVYMSGARRAVALIVIAAVVGLPILMLMPAWIMGAAAWRFMRAGGVVTTPAAWICAIGGPLTYGWMLAVGMPGYLLALTGAVHGVNMNATFAFSDEYLWNAIIGLLTVAHVLGMASLLQNKSPDWRPVRWFAGASFSIYVTHYPSLHLLDATLPDVAGRSAMMLIGTILIGLAFAHLFERQIGPLRQALRRANTAFNPPKANALDSTTSTDALRASFGTTSSAHSGSGSS